MIMGNSIGKRLVQIKGLHKSFDGVEVLKGIDLEVRHREVVCIIGRSGSGKSTLLRCINGLEVFQQGELLVDDIALDYTNARAMRELRQKVGMIFQQFNLFPMMTAGQNVMLAPRLVRKLSKEEAKKQAEHQLERVGLAGRFE